MLVVTLPCLSLSSLASSLAFRAHATSQGPSELSLACANDPASAQAVFDEELLATSANLAPGIDSLATPDGFLYSVQLQGGAWWSVSNLTWSLEAKEEPSATTNTTSSGIESLQALLAEVNARPEAWCVVSFWGGL